MPSIVYGLLALGLFVYAFGLGQSVHTAGLTLALLILPVVIVATREAIRSIPGMIREGAYAVGATKWQTTKDHIIPYSLPGILTGVIIGLSRAIGETAPIITIGALTFIAFLPPSPVNMRFPVPEFRVAEGPVHGDADPDVQLDQPAGRGIPRQCGGRRHDPRLHDPGDEWAGDLAPLSPAQEHQMVTAMEARTQTTTHATMLGSARSGTIAPAASDAPAPPLKAESRNLSFHYGKFQALKSISMPVHEYQVTALIGPSGCGKSTFLRCFNRMHDLYPNTRYDGEIVLHPDNTNLLADDVDPIEVRMRVSMVFQKPNPFPKSIYENVAYGLRVRGIRNQNLLDEKVEHVVARRGALGRGQASAERGRVQPFGRPAATPVHRARARHRPGDHALRRADLRARPDRDREHRGADLGAEEEGDDRNRHPQHQQAARVSDYTAYMYLGEVVEFDKTDTIFFKPRRKETEDYITGRFG